MSPLLGLYWTPGVDSSRGAAAASSLASDMKVQQQKEEFDERMA